MIGKDDVRDFLMSRRANVTPAQAGLPRGGGDRRVPELRREEVAILAGVSADYYIRLERGDIGTASRSVLEAIARACNWTTSNASTSSTSPATPRPTRPTTPTRRMPGRCARLCNGSSTA